MTKDQIAKMTPKQKAARKAKLWAEAEATSLSAYESVCRINLHAARQQAKEFHNIMEELTLLY